MAEYKINYTQSNFTGGIIAAELYGRNDFNKVKTGLKKCTNWTIREAGGLEFRRGTKYLLDIPAAAGNNFKIASINKALLLFCKDKIRYYFDRQGAGNYWGTLNYPEGMQTNIKIEQTIGSSLSDLTVDLKTFGEGIGSLASVTATFLFDGTNWIYDGNTVDLTDYGISFTGTPVIDDAIKVTYVNELDLSELHFTELKRKLYFYDGTINLCEISLDSLGMPSVALSTFETEPTGATISSTTSGANPDPYVLVDHTYTFSLAKDEEHETVVSPYTTTQHVNAELSEAYNTEDNKGIQVNVSITLTPAQQSEYVGGKILVYKKYQGYFYFLSAIDITEDHVGAYVFEDKGQATVDMSKTPKDNPDYLDGDGHIKNVNSIADYNQRLFLTQSGQDVTRIIFSEVGNTDSLAYSSQRNEDEAGDLELPISHYDSWCKVVSGLDLILSTSYTISKVSGYGDLTTETILWDGLSKDVEPVRTRRSLIYTNTSNRNIYDLTYNEYGQYDSIDLTLLVKYIFEEKTIKKLAFKDYPVKTIYVLCDDGDLYCLTYIKDQNIYAWYKIEHEGTITDICVINIDTEDKVCLVVKYGNKYVVERAYQRTDTIYLDCCVEKKITDVTPYNTITGLNMFEGKKVRVFDAGNNIYYGKYDIMNPKTIVEGGKTVEIDDLDFDGLLVKNGTIQLPPDTEFVGPLLIGFPYYAVAETIPLEFQDQNGNSTIGRKKAVNEAYLRYGDSRGVSYKTMGHEYDCGICERDVADNAQFLERGQVKLHTVSEYKWDSTIKILQRQPYPARIESITLGLTFNDKS